MWVRKCEGSKTPCQRAPWEQEGQGVSSGRMHGVTRAQGQTRLVPPGELASQASSSFNM